MNGILQESQFNTVGTIKVKIRSPADSQSDGESPSIVMICKHTFLFQTVGCLFPAVWSEINIHRCIYKLFTLTRVMGLLFRAPAPRDGTPLHCEPFFHNSCIFRTWASADQVCIVIEQRLLKENQRTVREWDWELLWSIFPNSTDSQVQLYLQKLCELHSFLQRQT